METIFLNIPTAKTVNISTSFRYVTYMLSHLQKMLVFTSHSKAKYHFHLYQGIQRYRQEMVNILVNGGRKYNRSERKNTKKNRKKRKKRRNKNANDKNKQAKTYTK
jgi:F0F1-type ATP synthase epsilon subunit